MRWLRIAWKLPAAVAVTLAMAAIPLAARVVLAGKPGAIDRVGASATHWWGVWMCRILRVKRDVRGAPAKDGAFLVASNHLSYLDILVLGSLYTSVFVAKREIAGWPIFGLIARTAGTLFVDREQARDVVRAGREMAARLASGVPLTIFPEGRSSPGTDVQPFLPSLLEPAAAAGVPCWAAAITYEASGSALPPSVTICWYDSSSFPAHVVRMMGLARIVAHVRFAAAPVVSDDRKTLARTLWTAVAAEFTPVRQAEGPAP